MSWTNKSHWQFCHWFQWEQEWTQKWIFLGRFEKSNRTVSKHQGGKLRETGQTTNGFCKSHFFTHAHASLCEWHFHKMNKKTTEKNLLFSSTVWQVFYICYDLMFWQTLWMLKSTGWNTKSTDIFNGKKQWLHIVSHLPLERTQQFDINWCLFPEIISVPYLMDCNVGLTQKQSWKFLMGMGNNKAPKLH